MYYTDGPQLAKLVPALHAMPLLCRMLPSSALCT